MTTLHEAIKLILNRKGVPMAPWEIEKELAISDEYLKKDLTKPKAQQIVSRIRKYPQLFQLVNGYVINVDDEDLITLVKSVNRIKILLSDIFSFENVQLMIASFLFYKRLIDIKTLEDSSSESFIDFKFLRRLEFLRSESISIFYDLENQLRRIDRLFLSEVYNLLRNIETAHYEEERFASIFEFIVYNLSAEKSSFKNSSPEFIRYLIPKLVNKKYVNRVFDPTAGMGGILTSALKVYSYAEIQATEINIQSALIGNLNLYLHGKKSAPIQTTSFFRVDSSGFDVIVSDFPISGVSYKSIGNIGFDFFNYKSNGRGFAPLVMKCFELLSLDGKAIVTIGDSFLTKGGIDNEIRRFLIQRDVVETIISLPSGVYRPYSNAKMSILILNKNKSVNMLNKVRFIHGSSIEVSKNGVVLDVEKVIDEYLFFRENTKFQNVINIDDLDHDMNLTAERNSPQNLIRKRMLKGGNAFFLDSIADIKRGLPKTHIADLPKNIPFIKIEDLDEEELNIELKLKIEFNVIEGEEFVFTKHKISEPCILMSIVGDKLKTNIFFPTLEIPYIIISSNIVAISLKSDLWDLEYVYFQLNSSFVRDQINSFRKGNIISYITIKDVKNILIPYASLDDQKIKIDHQKSEIIFKDGINENINLTKEEIDKEKEQSELDLVRTITHQLKHMLSSVNTHVEKIKRISDVNNLGDMKEYVDDDSILENQDGFEPAENKSLNETIINAHKSTLLLNQILDDVKKAIHLEMRLNMHPIKEIIQEAVRNYPDINIIISGADLEVKLSKSHMVDIFRTLICNSIEHSFKDFQEGKITINIKKLTDVVILEYNTNGEPIKISEREYKSIATKSTSSKGTGMGGYYVHKVIQAHNGKLRIKEGLKTGVKIEIEIPILNDYE